MRDHKLKVTRPEFLLELMASGDVDALTMQNMKLALHDTTPLCYCTYTVLMEADIDPSDVESMHNDGESIAVSFYKKAHAKMVVDLCNKSKVRYGSKKYKVKLKQRDRHVISEIKEIPEADQDVADYE